MIGHSSPCPICYHPHSCQPPTKYYLLCQGMQIHANSSPTSFKLICCRKDHHPGYKCFNKSPFGIIPFQVFFTLWITKLWQLKSSFFFFFSSMFKTSVGSLSTHNLCSTPGAENWELALFKIAMVTLFLNFYVFHRYYISVWASVGRHGWWKELFCLHAVGKVK